MSVIDQIEIYQWDGTCHGGLGRERLLDDMIADLRDHGLMPWQPEKRCLPAVEKALPGRPTGNCNVCTISLDHYYQHARWLSQKGFQTWPSDCSPVDDLYGDEDDAGEDIDRDAGPGLAAGPVRAMTKPDPHNLPDLRGYFVQIYFDEASQETAPLPGQLTLRLDSATGRIKKACLN